jgi:hypothetical protein
MKEIIIIETQNGEKIKSLLNKERVNYQIIYDELISTKHKENVFAHYGEALKDKEQEKEAQELENAEEEDIINEEW